MKIHDSSCDEYALKAGGHLNAMKKFCTSFGLKLSNLIFSATEQLSITLQGKNTTMLETVSSANLAMSFLEGQRNEELFNAFYDQVVSESKELTSEPYLPRYRQPLKRFAGAPGCTYDDSKSYFRKLYNEAFDSTCGELRNHFQQTRGMPIAAVIKKTYMQLIINCDYNLTIPKELDMYAQELDLQ